MRQISSLAEGLFDSQEALIHGVGCAVYISMCKAELLK